MLVLALIISGISYAIWSTTKEQTSINKISSGCLKLSVQEGTSIDIPNAYQTPDVDGLKQDGYTFTINNNCNHEEYVEVNLDIKKNNTLDAKNIRATLLYNNQKIIEPNNLNNLLDRETTNKEYNIGKHLTTVRIDANKSKKLNLKIWLDENTSFNDLKENNTFESKIEINSIKRENILASDYVRIISEDNEELAYDETIDNNLRYIGATPDNYIDIGNGTYDSDLYYGYANKDSISYPEEYTSLESCQQAESKNINCILLHKKGDPILWRIIGVMNNVENETGKKESRIKLIRADSLNKGMAYDYRCDGDINLETKSCTGKLIFTHMSISKNWNESSLQKILNNEYYNQEIAENVFELNYLYNGSSYNWKTDYLDYDFRNRGLSKKTKEYIEPATYYLGNIRLTENEQNLNTKEIYKIERSKKVEDNFPSEWTGNVGLMYLSDFGFSADDKNTCLNSTLYDYSTNGCRGKTWVLDNKYNYEHWTIDGHMVKSRSTTFGYNYSYFAVTVLPTVYLKSNVLLTSGDGSKTNPYKLSL